MKNKILNILKPSIFSVIFAVIVTGWHFFYSYQGNNFNFLTDVRKYLRSGLSAVSWNNYFVKSLSLLLIWIVVAGVIFALIWGIEAISVYLHNKKLEAKMINKTEGSMAPGYRVRTVNLKDHFVALLFIVGAVIFVILTFIFGTDLLEKVRFSAVDNLVYNVQESGDALDYNNPILNYLSFAVCFFVWYLYSSILKSMFQKGKVTLGEAQIADDHYAVVVNEEVVDEDDEEEINSRNELKEILGKSSVQVVPAQANPSATVTSQAMTQPVQNAPIAVPQQAASITPNTPLPNQPAQNPNQNNNLST